jgi:hypothetical protein
LVLRGPFGAPDCVALDFLVVFEAVARTGVLVSCDDAEDGVAAESEPSLGMTEVVDVVVGDFEVDFVRRVISFCEAVVSVGRDRSTEGESN